MCTVSRSLRANPIEREAQQIAEPFEHRVGRVGVTMHQRRDCVERVEQEVRVQLPLQRLQVRFGKPRTQLRRGQLALLRLAMEIERVAQTDDRPVGHHLPVEVQEEQLLEVHRPRHVSAGERLHDEDAARHPEQGVRQREDDDAADVPRRSALPRMAAEAIAPRHPHHPRDEHRPRVPVGDVQREQDVERLLPVREEGDVVVGLETREDPKGGRNGEDP